MKACIRSRLSPERPGTREAVTVSALADVVNIPNPTPDTTQLPGSNALQSLINGLDGWALFLTLAALLVGAVVWALGSHSQNYHQSLAGRRAVIVSALAALVLGAGPAIVHTFFHIGASVVAK
jgi:hypothetical protein